MWPAVLRQRFFATLSGDGKGNRGDAVMWDYDAKGIVVDVIFAVGGHSMYTEVGVYYELQCISHGMYDIRRHDVRGKLDFNGLSTRKTSRWYFIPGRSFTRPPLIITVEYSCKL